MLKSQLSSSQFQDTKLYVKVSNTSSSIQEKFHTENQIQTFSLIELLLIVISVGASETLLSVIVNSFSKYNQA